MTRPVLAVIETSIGPYGMEPLRIARDLGLRPILFSAEPGRYPLAPQDEVILCDTTNPGEILNAVSRVPAPLAGVFSLTDYSVHAAALAAAGRGLPGLDPEVARLARDKAATNAKLGEVGVPCANQLHVRTVTEAVEAAEQLGYPVVVKPRAEAGGIGVSLCENQDDLSVAVEHQLLRTHDYRGRPIPTGCLIEEFLIGRECSVEVLVLDGRYVVVGMSDKFLSPLPHFIETGHLFPSAMRADDCDSVLKVALTALGAIGYNFGAAHLEIKLTADGPKVIEINPRVVGTPMPEIVTLATGRDYLRTVIALHAGLISPSSIQKWPAATRWVASRDLVSLEGGSLSCIRGEREAKMIPGVYKVSIHTDRSVVRPAKDNTDWLATTMSLADTPYLAWRSAEVATGLLRPEWAEL